MLRLLLTPVRWLVRLLVFLIVVALLLIWLLPAAFDIPARAAAAIDRINAARAAGVSIQAVPTAVEGFPPRLLIHDLRLTAPGAKQPALVAAETVVQVDMVRSLTRQEVVLRVDIMNPQIAADQPFSLAAANTALTAALGVTTVVGIVGGQVVNSAGRTVIDLGDSGTIIVPPAGGATVIPSPAPSMSGVPSSGAPTMPAPGLIDWIVDIFRPSTRGEARPHAASGQDG